MPLARFRYWLNRTQRDLRREMESHIEEKTSELVEQGYSESAARSTARRRFGNMGLTQEDSREIWIARWWSDF